MDISEDIELHELETIERNLSCDGAGERDAQHGTDGYAVLSPSGFMVLSASGFMVL